MNSVSVNWVSDKVLDLESGGYVAFTTKEGAFLGLPKELEETFAPMLKALKDSGDLKGSKKEIHVLYNGDLKTKRLVLAGLGKSEKVELQTFREVAGIASRKLRNLKAGSVTFLLPDMEGFSPEELARAIVEGAILGSYKFVELKTKEKEKFVPISSINVFAEKDVSEAIRIGKIIAEATNLARDLANRPSNIATPTHFVSVAKDALQGLKNVEVKALDERECEELGMGSFLSVAKGTDEPAKFLVMEYWGADRSKAPVVVVGKGITFDTGGISLKPQSVIIGMKGDCSGAAATIGTIKAAAELELPLNVIGLAPLTENMPSGKATKPEDVVFAMNGKSIEIINTDAEGRLILADALCYAEQYKPKWVVDLATLTGAIVIALGDQAAGLFSKDDQLRKRLKLAGERSGERLWSMPLFDGYYNQLKSKVADMKNVGGRPAGSCTAAAFLSNFAEGFPWAHIDIAGVAWVEKPTPLCEEGMTGAGVRVMTELLLEEAKQ